MAGETVITVIGNLTGDPELRFTPSGKAVANFTIASTPRTFDRATGEWKEGETLFLRASVWEGAAENVAESLRKGMRVIAQGNLKSRSYETKEGERRTSNELEIQDIGASLRFATAQVTRNPQGSGRSSGGQSLEEAQRNAQNQAWGAGTVQPNQQAGTGNQQESAGAGNVDPWASASPGQYDWGTSGAEEPPF